MVLLFAYAYWQRKVTIQREEYQVYIDFLERITPQFKPFIEFISAMGIAMQEAQKRILALGEAIGKSIREDT